MGAQHAVEPRFKILLRIDPYRLICIVLASFWHGIWYQIECAISIRCIDAVLWPYRACNVEYRCVSALYWLICYRYSSVLTDISNFSEPLITVSPQLYEKDHRSSMKSYNVFSSPYSSFRTYSISKLQPLLHFSEPFLRVVNRRITGANFSEPSHRQRAVNHRSFVASSLITGSIVSSPFLESLIIGASSLITGGNFSKSFHHWIFISHH
uniref:Uncharacterized protein n=1 Tax=Nelumbo nucifera TaxID=4432 RepID=A0A822ZQ66_NELNU|nr:TPA_asm: hypothetical protein HUJ06_002178 [Nelumbo nucifera]